VKGPRHLWTGDWRSDSRENAESLEGQEPFRTTIVPEDDAPPPSAEREPSHDPAPTTTTARPRYAARRGLAAVGVVLLAVAVAFGAGALLGGGDSKKPAAQVSAALPAVDAAPLKPRKGQTRAGAVYAAASPAVVSIRNEAGGDSGTAFLVDNKGTLVTNAHVVSGAQHVTARFGLDGKSIDADVLGTDPSTDLAAVSIPASTIPAGTKALRFADSRNVRVGDIAIAIGNPFGLDRTATEGIVSAIGRSIESPNRYSIDNVIQTDAPINPGNSGGPLLSDSGLVIGLNAQIYTGGTSSGNVGIGFAIPSNTVRQVLPALERGQAIKRAYMGVSSGPPDQGRAAGAQIAQVVAGGPADRAGVQVGDVIRSVDGVKVPDYNELSTIVERYRPGDRVKIVVERDGASRTLEVTLGTRPSSPSTP
jgi:putative serine protease PepD